MKKNSYFIYFIIILFILITTHKMINLILIDARKKWHVYEVNTTLSFLGSSAPRGRILDTNGKVIVDNIGVNTLIFNGLNISVSEYTDIALHLADILDISDDVIRESYLKIFYLKIHNDGRDLITKSEYEKFENRELNSSDIESLKYSRITSEMLDNMSTLEKKASYIYHKMNDDYYYQDKVIKKHLTDSEVAKINDANIKGVRVILKWERTYPYGNMMISILGGVNVVPFEYKDYYLKKGVKLNSTVGVSGLEFQYDDYLRGKDAVYEIDKTGKKVLVKEEEQGSDLYLSIDIDLEAKLYDVMKEEIKNARNTYNGVYFDHTYAIVGDPNTGGIIALLGLLYENDNYIDITTNIVSSSYTVGSIVKGASISVGYSENLITPGEYILDSCIKVYGVQEKCSYLNLGYVNDVDALAMSSNYYQFLIAAHLANPNYYYNSHLYASKTHFDIYRNMFASYGLGAITGIDLPKERIGIIGSTISDDLLLNLTIGQYDTYTPIEVYQYINTIANNGYRIKPSLMKKIVGKDKTIEHESEILNEVNLDKKYLERIKLGFKGTFDYGTAYFYNMGIPAGGKTGTSETFIDSDGDGIMDTKTISNAFIMFIPFDNPKYTVTIISPNIGLDSSPDPFRYPINYYINKGIYEYLFDKL